MGLQWAEVYATLCFKVSARAPKRLLSDFHVLCFGTITLERKINMLTQYRFSMRRNRWTGIYPLVGSHFGDYSGEICIESSYFSEREEEDRLDHFIPNASHWSWHVHCGQGPCPRCGALLDYFHPNIPIMSFDTTFTALEQINLMGFSNPNPPIFLMHYRNNRGAIDYTELYMDAIMGPLIEGMGDIIIIHSYILEEKVRRIKNSILNGFSNDELRAAADDRIKFVSSREVFPDGEWRPRP